MIRNNRIETFHIVYLEGALILFFLNIPPVYFFFYNINACLIRRNKKHFKQENVKPYNDSISLPNNPTVSEVKRNIALEDDVIKKILPQRPSPA